MINLLCYIYRCTSIEIKPELHKNILKSGYGINYKYEGMLTHSFKRFNVVTKFILKNEVDFILPKYPADRKSKRGIFSTIISGFVCLAFE